MESFLSLLHGARRSYVCRDGLSDCRSWPDSIVAKAGNARDILKASKVGITTIDAWLLR